MKRTGHRKNAPGDAPSPVPPSDNKQWSAALAVPRDALCDAPPKDTGDPSKRGGFTGDKLIQLYLKEASETPLLTPIEEFQVGVLNAEGNEDARQRLIKSNLLLVVSVAKDFRDFGLDFTDLIALGNIGLMRAVDKFDPHRGARFATYASWWIRQAIMRGLTNDSTTIRLPAHRHQQVRELMKAERELTDRLEREPSVEELALHLGISEEQVKHRFQAAHVRATVPLDGPLSTDPSRESASLNDTLPDPNVVVASEAMVRQEQRNLVLAILGDRTAFATISEGLRPLVSLHQARFKEREIDVLTKRFGLGRAKGKTLEEIGSEYHVTRERIRQVEARALMKFKRALEHIDRARDREAEAVLAALKNTPESSR